MLPLYSLPMTTGLDTKIAGLPGIQAELYKFEQFKNGVQDGDRTNFSRFSDVYPSIFHLFSSIVVGKQKNFQLGQFKSSISYSYEIRQDSH